ncbi:putative parvulin-type peptidyl-prolyl cis-trans isomerase [Patescibacteria group bacterium]|nr:putative parvulin-type peptidyl-prolyl cis-trans isomerase [Patescibacteria group bacterium]
MKKTLVSLLLTGSVLLIACDGNSPADKSTSSSTSNAATVKKEDAVAEVNGQYISKAALADLEKEVSVRAQGQSFPKEKLVEELIQRQLLLQDATQKKLDQSPEVIAQLNNIKEALLTKAALESYLKANPVTDAELKAEYDSKVGGSNAIEYKASHILVKTEDEAKKLIAELDKGAKFAEVANKFSLDAKDSQNGGDLGWFSAGQMVEEFSKAVEKLEKGKYSKEPVKTQFGYHIILREDSRAQTPPPFDAVKEGLKPFLERKKVQTMMETMRKSAKVEILVPLTDEKPAVATPTAEEKPATPPSIEDKEKNAALEAGTPAKPADVKPEAAKADKPAEEAKPADNKTNHTEHKAKDKK